MARLSDKLTDVVIRQAKPKEKTYRLSDGKGLQLAFCSSFFMGTLWRGLVQELSCKGQHKISYKLSSLHSIPMGIDAADAPEGT